MPSPTKTPTARLVTAVNINRRAVPSLADNDVWRAFLTVNGGGDSTRAMSVDQLRSVMDALEKAGAPPPPKQSRTAAGQDGMIRDLWRQLWAAGGVDDAGEAALAAWAKRISRVDALAFARPGQKRIMIEALKDWLRRVADDPVTPLRLVARGEDGRTDFVRLCDGLWGALIQCRALEHGIFADPGTWLMRKGFGVSAFCHLDQGKARDAARQLAVWLRQKTEKAANHV